MDRYAANDRAPTKEEIQRLLEYPDRYLSNPEQAFKKNYSLENEATEEHQKLIRPILNQMWMSESLRGVSQQFSNNCTEESSKQSESPKHVISGNGNGNGNSQIKYKKYSDYLVDGVPIWQLEHRGMTPEEEEAYRKEVERLKKEA